MIIVLIKIFLIGWFITNFEPITKFIDNKMLMNENKILNKAYDIVSCQYCLTFWLTIIVTMNIWYAIFMAFLIKSFKK